MSGEITGAIPRQHILFVDAQPKANMLKSGFPENIYEKWIKNALGLSEDTDRLTTVNLFDDEELPNPDSFSAIIIGGSAHAAYEDHPRVRTGEMLVRQIASTEKPLLAICFGHQLVHNALGGHAEATRSESETGIYTIKLTNSGRRDPLFIHMPDTFQGVESHGDVVLTPAKTAQRLATTATHQNQAFAIGDAIRTIQFHPEISPEDLAILVISRKERLKEKLGFSEDAFASFVESIKQADTRYATMVIQNFARNIVGNIQ